jgi:hypothetical protein
MFLHPDNIVADETNATWYTPPPLNAARGIAVSLALSAALWGSIIAIVWLLAR